MLKLKPFEQSRGLCGPTSLRSVFDYFGIKKTEKEIAKLAGATEEKGTTAHGMLKAARRLGFKAWSKDMAGFADIAKLLKRKIPVIVDWFHNDDGHYSVVVELTKKHVVLMNPRFGTFDKINRLDFKRIWFDFPGDYLKNKNDIIIRRMIVIEPKS